MTTATAPQFIGSTIGLLCNRQHAFGKMVRIHYYRNADGTVLLGAVCGRAIGGMPGQATISDAEFDSRPSDPYDSVKEARWALGKVGWVLAGECE